MDRSGLAAGAHQGTALPSRDRNKVVVSGLWTEVDMGLDDANTTVHKAPQRTATPSAALAWEKY